MRFGGLFSVVVFCTFLSGAAPPAFDHLRPWFAPLGVIWSRSGPAKTSYALNGSEAWSGSNQSGLRAQSEQNPPPPSPPVTPSQPQPSPAPTPQSVQPQPAEPAQGQSTPAATEATRLEPAQLQDLLQKVCLAAFRFTDLLTVLQKDKWKMDDAARQSFTQTLETVRGQLKTLDENRKHFLENPENSDLADKTDAAVTALLPSIEAVASAVTQYDSPVEGAQYKQPADQLRGLQKSLQPYVLYLHAKAEAPATPPQPQTSPAAQAPAPTQQGQPTSSSQSQPASAVNEGVKLEPAQLRDLLQRIFVVTFRFKDLVSILQPDKWQMDDTARQSFNHTLETVRGQLKTLDENRTQFLERPENLELASKTDAAITALLPNLDVVAADVTQYDSPGQGAQYKQPGDQLRELQKSLHPYVVYLQARAEAPVTPPQPQTSLAPAAQAPAPTQQGQPTSLSQVQPPLAVNEGVKLEPAQLRDLLQRIFVVTFRFKDLVSILQPDKWQMDDTARQSFNQTLETVRGQLKTLDENRTQFLERPENLDLAGKTDAAITALLPNLDVVAADVTQYDRPGQGAQYKQPGDQLRELQKSLHPYVVYLQAKAEAALAPIPGVQTEVIEPSTIPKAILPTDISGPPPPMQLEQLKQVLYKMYVPTYRIQDVLSHEQPENSKASEAERARFGQARGALQAKLTEFEKVRNQFAASPGSADLAFQTYVSALSVQDPLEQVTHSLSTQGETKLADEFRQRGRELIAAQQELVPYISYFVNRWDRAAQMFQNNLAACEKQLNYAMHLRTQAAIPLPNINPEFQGHGRKTTSSTDTATKAAATKSVKRTAPKKAAKKSSTQATAKAGQAKP